jgi:S1-C subfamily serine protease
MGGSDRRANVDAVAVARRHPPPSPDVASREVEAPSRLKLLEPQPNVAEPPTPPEKTGVSTGTGFFVDDSGDLLTNSHVIEDCSDIKGRMPDKPSWPRRRSRATPPMTWRT